MTRKNASLGAVGAGAAMQDENSQSYIIGELAGSVKGLTEALREEKDEIVRVWASLDETNKQLHETIKAVNVLSSKFDQYAKDHVESLCNLEDLANQHTREISELRRVTQRLQAESNDELEAPGGPRVWELISDNALKAFGTLIQVVIFGGILGSLWLMLGDKFKDASKPEQAPEAPEVKPDPADKKP